MPCKTPLIALLMAIATSLLLACGDGRGPSAPPAAEAASRLLQPQDAPLAAIYQRSCASCHTVAATGAPLTGDTAAWAPRLDKGMAQLVDNVVNGYGGMPPFGMCMDCDVAQFEALTQFMSAGQ